MKRRALFRQVASQGGLVAYYSFDGNANDSLGLNNGSVSGSPSFVAGKNGTAIDFGSDTTVRYAVIPDNDIFSFTDSINDIPFSISFWVNFSGFSASQNILINRRPTSSGTNEWQIAYDGSGIYLLKWDKTNNTTAYQYVKGNLSPTLGTWYHIVVTDAGTKNSSDMKTYINSVSHVETQATIGTYTGMGNGISDTYIGVAAWDSNDYLKHRGLLDELSFWKNKVLTQSEVDDLYNSGAGKFYPF